MTYIKCLYLQIFILNIVRLWLWWLWLWLVAASFCTLEGGIRTDWTLVRSKVFVLNDTRLFKDNIFFILSYKVAYLHF